MNGIEENYAVLAVAILHPKYLTVEMAGKLYSDGPQPKRGGNLGDAWTDLDCEDAIKLKESGLTWKQVGEIYGLETCAMYRRIKNYRDRS